MRISEVEEMIRVWADRYDIGLRAKAVRDLATEISEASKEELEQHRPVNDIWEDE